MSLKILGWSEIWDPFIQDKERAVRITAVHRGSYRATDAKTDFNGYLSGKFQHTSSMPSDFPAVGDWCLTSPPFQDEKDLPAVLIEKVLPRKSKISRMAAGIASEEQILAANIDQVFIVTSANQDLNINRLQRYLLLAGEGNVKASLILSKVDLCSNHKPLIENLQGSFPQVPVTSTSIPNNVGLDQLRSSLKAGSTSVFLGSSGVGKSTLVNYFLGEQRQLTKTIREDDDKGRHATTSRELFIISNGGMIIDTPGLRELGVFGTGEGLKSVFKNIDELSQECKFSNCSHTTEPDCRVQEAISRGELDANEMENYDKLQREMEHENSKLDKRYASNQKKRWKSRSIHIKKFYKIGDKRKT